MKLVYLLCCLGLSNSIKVDPNAVYLVQPSVPMLPNNIPLTKTTSSVIGDWFGRIFYRNEKECAVDIPQGKVTGTYRSSYRQYLGIPYAKAPIGSLRWRSPIPADPFENGIHFGKEFGNHCYQIDHEKPNIGKKVTIGARSLPSEDCLNLNIWTPRKNHLKDKGLPVIIFIHGGAFSKGANSMPLYDPTKFISNNKNIIVVSINYRLGIFGFLASSDLENECKKEETGFGNYGLEDQILAIQWVKNNIAAFGGDPSNITLFGHSAGAISVNYLLHILGTSKANVGKLFSRAILQSGTTESWATRHLHDGVTQQSYDKLIKDMDCKVENPLDCLRSVAANQITGYVIAQDWTMIWGPVVDNRLILDEPKKMLEREEYLKGVELLFTSTVDDGTLFVPGNPRSEQDFHKIMKSNFKEKTDLVLSMYKPNQSKSFFKLSAEVIRDAIFRCPSVRVGSSMAKWNPTFYYQFKEKIFLTNAFSKIFMGNSLGVFHGSELMSIFEYNSWILTLHERNRAEELQKKWISFAQNGVPKKDEDKTFHQLPFFLGSLGKCKFWDEFSFEFPRAEIENS